MTVSGLGPGRRFPLLRAASAQRAGVFGWVRNTDDGTVEIYAEGTDERLQQFIQAIRRGPTQGRSVA